MGERAAAAAARDPLDWRLADRAAAAQSNLVTFLKLLRVYIFNTVARRGDRRRRRAHCQRGPPLRAGKRGLGAGNGRAVDEIVRFGDSIEYGLHWVQGAHAGRWPRPHPPASPPRARADHCADTGLAERVVALLKPWVAPDEDGSKPSRAEKQVTAQLQLVRRRPAALPPCVPHGAVSPPPPHRRASSTPTR